MTASVPAPVPGHFDNRGLGRPLPLAAAVRLMLAGIVVMLVFGSGLLREFMTYLPLWMDPVDLWLMDLTAAWDDWMAAIGATEPYRLVRDWVQELAMWGAAG